MNWEKSKAATPLKRGFLKSFFTKETRFYLTGGSALGLFYLQHRFSQDLDLFTGERVDWMEMDGIMRLCAEEIGADLNLLRDSLTFRRYGLKRGGDTEIIDLVVDVSPQIDAKKEWIDDVQVDTLHEIMLNKITTLVSRCDIKDLVDLYFLEKEGFQVEAYFEEAQQKDGGLDPSIVSMLLNSVKVSELPDYLIKPLTVEEIECFIDDLKRRMALMALPNTNF